MKGRGEDSLFSEVTLFDHNVSTIMSPIVSEQRHNVEWMGEEGKLHFFVF